MTESTGFRQDLVDAYCAKVKDYVTLMELRDSYSTVGGGEHYLADWRRDHGIALLTDSEGQCVALALRSEIGRDNRIRGGQKRIESAEVVGRQGSKLTFKVTYSDLEVVFGFGYREYALRLDQAWSRGDGWPEANDWAAPAALRWKQRQAREAAVQQ